MNLTITLKMKTYKMSLWVVLVALLLCYDFSDAQSYNQNRTALTSFLVRMYENAPFDGVKAVEDYDNSYLMSVVKLDKTKYNTEAALNRVASVKAMSQASRFFNGSNITDDMIIRTTERSDGTSDTEIIENIREHSAGYVKQLEHLTNFPAPDGHQVFIFIAPLTLTNQNN